MKKLIYLHDDLNEILRYEAYKRRTSMSGLVQRALIKYLNIDTDYTKKPRQPKKPKQISIDDLN